MSSKKAAGSKPTNAGLPAKKTLAPKEASSFKELLNLYETRQLKRALKTADAILKKVPDHGETLSMRGLVLVHMGRRDEGIEQVKKGAKMDLTSHIVWHVFGLVQKGEKKWAEAAKSYSMGLRFDKDNFNILRDLASLQTQLRQYDALVDTRLHLFRLRPSLRQHWLALALAHHLSGDLASSYKVMQGLERIVKNVPNYDFEHSETLLYGIRIAQELGVEQKGKGEEAEAKKTWEYAINLLDVSAKSRSIVDRTKVMEYRAKLLTYLQASEAPEAWLTLIDHNSDCLDYYHDYLSFLGLSTTKPSPEAISKLKELASQHPKARAPQRILLSLSSGEEFRELVEPYIKGALEKGVPSLFSDLKSLYSDAEKRTALEELVTSMLDSADLDPSTRLWTLYYLAQHFSHLSSMSSISLQQHMEYGKQALSYVDQATQHTPTLPEIWTVKARILKRLGSPHAAARAVQEARLLDGQDRFINTKCAKYLFRAGAPDAAENILGLFTKRDAPSPGSDLEDMQSMLYLVEAADSYAHIGGGSIGRALKRYSGLLKVFNDYGDEQYDFHGYSIRRSTLNVYVDLLKWEDSLRLHPLYVRSAVGSSKILVAVHDDPSLAKVAPPQENLSEAEKKAKKKAKKAAHAKANETKMELDKKGSNNVSSNEDKGLDPPAPKDEDPDGVKALSTPKEELIEKAWGWLSPVVLLLDQFYDEKAERRIPVEMELSVWIAVYDVAVRRSKYLLAVKALHRAKGLNVDPAPDLHVRLVDIRRRGSAMSSPLPEAADSAFKAALNDLVPPEDEVSLQQYNSTYLQQQGSKNAKCILASARVMHALGIDGLDAIENTCFVSSTNADCACDATTADEIVKFLASVKSSRTEELRQAFDKKFEMSTLFKTAEEQAAMRKTAVEVDVQELSEPQGHHEFVDEGSKVP